MATSDESEKATSLLTTLLPLVLDLVTNELSASKGKWSKAFPSKEIRRFFDASLKKIDGQKNDTARIIGKEIGEALAAAIVKNLPELLSSMDLHISFSKKKNSPAALKRKKKIPIKNSKNK